jgi:hypothetical protein
MQHVASTAPMRDECLTQPPQLELVGHSIVSVFCFEHPHTTHKKEKKKERKFIVIKVQSSADN